MVNVNAPAPTLPPRVRLVHGPTPLERPARLAAKLGVDLWVKRDDATGGAEAGNKVRKLEYLLADAVAKRSTVVLTCGGEQSNHARATALTCASLGLRTVLFLRREAGDEADAAARIRQAGGNLTLDRLAGAEIRSISRAEYAQRAEVMESAARALYDAGERPYVIPEGGSNGLGALGYVEAMRELGTQVALGLAGVKEPFDEIVVACGSGGTAAGVALGAAKYRVATRVRAAAVCDDAGYFERTIARIAEEARAYDPSLPPLDEAPLQVDDRSRGPAYGVATREQRVLLADVARTSGLVLDPVYTAKAFHALVEAIQRGEIQAGARVLFLHTGGLAGLLARNDLFDVGV